MQQAIVLASIVLGVAIAFELEHLNKVLRAKNVKWHWAQPIFALFVLLNIISYWWGLASKDDGEITLGAFLPIMFQLVVLALLAATSFPDEIDKKDGLNLAEYYQENRRYQWILMTVYLGSIHAGYVYTVAQSAVSVGDFLIRVVPDTIVGSIVIVMIFAKKWWQIALGFAVLSIAPIIWMTRSLG